MFKYGVACSMSDVSTTAPIILRGPSEQLCQQAKEIGYDGLEIQLANPMQYDWSAIRKTCNDYGLDLITGYVAGMAEELVRLYEQIPPSVRENKTRFFGSGNGIVRNRILWELTAEKLHAKIERERREEAAAAGAVRYILMEGT